MFQRGAIWPPPKALHLEEAHQQKASELSELGPTLPLAIAQDIPPWLPLPTSTRRPAALAKGNLC